MTHYDAIILGAGAAGLMAAISAGRRGRRVLLLDHAEEPGKKILISGGGRCNFTNLHCAPDRFVSANPHFAKSALGRYGAQDFIALVDRYAEMSATGALLFYSMFVMSAKPALVITVPLVLFGLFRYWFVVEALDGGESPTDALLADWQLLLTVVLWVLTCVWALWPVQG